MRAIIEQKLYKKILKVMPIPCVDIVIVRQKEFLLLKRKNRPAKGQWWFAGGRIFKGESLEKAALRKVREEIGAKVFLKRILGVGPTIFREGIFGGSIHSINIVFLANIRGKNKIALDSQSNSYEWFKKINPHWPSYIKKFLKLAGYAQH